MINNYQKMMHLATSVHEALSNYQLKGGGKLEHGLYCGFFGESKAQIEMNALFSEKGKKPIIDRLTIEFKATADNVASNNKIGTVTYKLGKRELDTFTVKAFKLSRMKNHILRTLNKTIEPAPGR